MLELQTPWYHPPIETLPSKGIFLHYIIVEVIVLFGMTRIGVDYLVGVETPKSCMISNLIPPPPTNGVLFHRNEELAPSHTASSHASVYYTDTNFTMEIYDLPKILT